MKLNVFFGNEAAGTLESTDNRGIVFSYNKEYLAKENVLPLSASLPLRENEFSQKECIPFFSGLLPEEDFRKKIAAYLHISETSTFKLLEALGGECAGLITISVEENPDIRKNQYSFDSDNYEKLDEKKLASFIEKMNVRPLIKADEKLRLSLAGAQEKLALAKRNGEWYLPLNGAPSTHILKPARNGDLASLGQNEYICMKLAKELKLDVPEVDLINISGKDIFIVERYDRILKANKIQRIHQEDFCQALSIMNTFKYQNDGGPGIKDIYSSIMKNCSVPALENRKFLQFVIFNFLIGNCDSHGKNYSLLYKRGIELAPLYDAVATTIYPELTDKVSMKIGNHYEIKKINRDDFILLAENLGIKLSVLDIIFNAFRKNFDSAFEKICSDKKIKLQIAEQIAAGWKERIQKILELV